MGVAVRVPMIAWTNGTVASDDVGRQMTDRHLADDRWMINPRRLQLPRTHSGFNVVLSRSART
jgi:hypothetical protein